MTMRCISCGADLDPEEEFCLACGNIIASRMDAPTGPILKPEPSFRWLLYVLGAVLVVLFVAVRPRGDRRDTEKGQPLS